MSLKKIYNDIAKRYAIANQFGSITQSHACAIQQILQERLGSKREHYKILDLGVGDGSFLKKLSEEMEHADFTGIDISSKMLTLAKQSLPQLVTIESSAAHADHYLPLGSQDLVVAHFINAYIPIDVLFSTAERLLRANGYFSLITTTYDSFPVAQQYLSNFIAKGTLWSSIVGHYYKVATEKTPVAANQEKLLSAFDAHQLKVIAHQRIHIPLIFHSMDELATFGVEGTWFLNTLTLPLLPKDFVIQQAKRLFKKIITFPYEDTHVIDVVLATKR